MHNNNFTRTKAAILKYAVYLSEWKREFDQMDESEMTGVEYVTKFWEMTEAHREYLRTVVANAFHEDTKEYNNLHNCELVVCGSKEVLPMCPKWISDLAGVKCPTW